MATADQTGRFPSLIDDEGKGAPMRNHDGSAMLDHRGRRVFQSKFLSTHPLRTDCKERVGFAGRKFTYVSGDGVIRTMNEAFGHGGWGSEITMERMVECEKDDKGRWVVGYLATVRVTLKNGVSHEDCGSGEGINESKIKAHEKAFKSAVTDAMKRAARHYGERLGNALYVKGNSIRTAPKDNKTALEQLELKEALGLFGDQGKLREQYGEKALDVGDQKNSSSSNHNNSSDGNNNSASNISEKQSATALTPSNVTNQKETVHWNRKVSISPVPSNEGLLSRQASSESIQSSVRSRPFSENEEGKADPIPMVPTSSFAPLARVSLTEPKWNSNCSPPDPGSNAGNGRLPAGNSGTSPQLSAGTEEMCHEPPPKPRYAPLGMSNGGDERSRNEVAHGSCGTETARTSSLKRSLSGSINEATKRPASGKSINPYISRV